MTREPDHDGPDRHDRQDGRTGGTGVPDRAVVGDSRRGERRDERYASDDYARRGPQQQQGNWAATASLICGIAGLILLFVVPPLGLLLALVAVVLGIIGLVKARHPYTGGTGQAVTGLVTGSIALVLTALLIWGLTALFQNSDLPEQLQEQVEQLQEEAGG